MPDPIMVPTIKAIPLKRSTFFFNLTPSVGLEDEEVGLLAGFVD